MLLLHIPHPSPRQHTRTHTRTHSRYLKDSCNICREEFCENSSLTAGSTLQARHITELFAFEMLPSYTHTHVRYIYTHLPSNIIT